MGGPVSGPGARKFCHTVYAGSASRRVGQVVAMIESLAADPCSSVACCAAAQIIKYFGHRLLTEVDAKYALETTAGERISVHNCGIRTVDAEDLAVLLRGDDVPADRIYCRYLPRLTTAAPRLAWMNQRLFIGVGERRPDTVELDIYRID